MEQRKKRRNETTKQTKMTGPGSGSRKRGKGKPSSANGSLASNGSSGKGKGVLESSVKAKKGTGPSPSKKAASASQGSGSVLSVGNAMAGFAAMCAAGYFHCLFMYQMHENNMWFSNIKEVEREISFRTEAGLYYSYYKQVVNAPSFVQGVQDLMNDKLTEHPDTINILERMNVYQEVFLAFLYRTFPIQAEPILFYVHSVFALQGLLIAGLFLMAWCISGTWLAGLLAAAFYSFNRYDTTRVYNSIALRENFSLPFLWLQASALTLYFKPGVSCMTQKLSVLAIFICTFNFCLGWQFNQFIMVLQSFSLFGVWILGFVPSHKIRTVILCQLMSLLAVCALQFCNKMIFSSWALSFNLGFLILLSVKKFEHPSGSFCGNVLRVIGLSLLSLLLMVALSSGIKVVLGVDSDDHIYKFLLNKFGIGDERDFDSRLYLCLGIFGFMTWDVVERMTAHLLFPLYVPAHALMLLALVYSVVQKWRSPRMPKSPDQKDKSLTKGSSNQINGCMDSRPELAFHIVQAVFFGALALIMYRMKYLWTPYVCVLAAAGIADMELWTAIFSQLKINNKTTVWVVRESVLVLTLAILATMIVPGILEELERLTEFWDPDTVELMQWISKNTAPLASLTGSMQLLAGVKLCTGRPITNHPHYEDKYLRHKTKELYQIYGRRHPSEVNAILKNYDSHYIILEDSICRAPSRGGCRTPDLVDIANGLMPDEPIAMEGLVHSQVPRFCEDIRHRKKSFLKFFKSVFVNKTFRVYKVL